MSNSLNNMKNNVFVDVKFTLLVDNIIAIIESNKRMINTQVVLKLLEMPDFPTV